jgi:hypothetical protein
MMAAESGHQPRAFPRADPLIRAEKNRKTGNISGFRLVSAFFSVSKPEIFPVFPEDS